MIFAKLYFWVAFVVVALVFVLFKKRNSEFFFSKFFPSHVHFAIIFSGAFVIGAFYNHDYQIYCQPVLWTKWLLIAVALWTLTIPVFMRLKVLNGILTGLAAFISIYLILFGSWEYLIFIALNAIFILPLFLLSQFLNKITKSSMFGFLNLYGIAILLPYIVLFLLVYMIFRSQRILILYSLIIPVLIVAGSIYTAIRMKEINHEIITGNFNKSFVKKYTQNAIDHYLLELNLGVHWKYHTRICLYDGRRPPYHDPILVLGRTFSLITGSIPEITPKESLESGLYKFAFPNNATTFDCLCGKYE